MSEEQFRDVLESALRGVHDDTDVAIIWADETITRLQGELDLLHGKSVADVVDYINMLEQRVQELEKQNALINAEYKKTWDVLRTYNPQDIELEYIGFETVEVKTSTD